MLDVMTESRKLERGRYGARRQASEKVPCVAASSMCSTINITHQHQPLLDVCYVKLLCVTE